MRNQNNMLMRIIFLVSCGWAGFIGFVGERAWAASIFAWAGCQPVQRAGNALQKCSLLSQDESA